MSDDQIREYLRSRADGSAPSDLLDAISRAADATPQQRRSWFASLAPAVVGMGLTAAVVLAAIMLTQSPDVGPPDPSSAPSTATPDPSVVSRPSPTPTPSASTDSGSLTDVGGILTMPAQDADGAWGSITSERLPDAGGLREIVNVDLDPEDPDPTSMFFVNDPAMFYLELSVEYFGDREPDPLDFGSDDWLVLGGPEPIQPIDVGLDALGSHLPGAMAVVGDRIAGIIRFAIPRDLAATELHLAYRPVGFDEPVWIAPLRTPGAPPEPLARITPDPIVYVERNGLPVDVVDSAGADALFATPDTCTNPVAGYTVTYPDDWYTNTAIGTWPACSWFSPTTYEVDDPDVIPGEIAIVLYFIPDSGPIGEPSQPVAGGPVEIDGRPTARHEFVGVGGGFMDIGSFVYRYEIGMSGQAPEEGETGDTLIAQAGWGLDDDPEAYRLATAVLDRIMASLTFDE